VVYYLLHKNLQTTVQENRYVATKRRFLAQGQDQQSKGLGQQEHGQCQGRRLQDQVQGLKAKAKA